MFVKTKRDFEPKTIEQAERAVKSKTILYASLGGEAGWPALQKISLTSAFNGNVIREITRKIGQRSISQINEFPFESISLLPSIAVHWLNHEVSEADYNFIKSLPKVELHCHLGGFSTQVGRA